MRILHVLGIEYKHSGEIQCIAVDPAYPSITESTFTELVVLPQPLQITNLDLKQSTEVSKKSPRHAVDVPAYLVRGPDDCTVLIGGTVSLTVQYGGYPAPSIKWLRAVSFHFLYFLLRFTFLLIQFEFIDFRNLINC